MLGGLIVTAPCDECNASDTEPTSTSDSLYLSELDAALLLLAQQVSPNQLGSSLKDISRTVSSGTPDTPEYLDCARSANTAWPSQALVINMTPTSIRVIEATVPDSRKPDIQVTLRDTVAHDVAGAEHQLGRHKDRFTSCAGCRRVLSWLHFASASCAPTETAVHVVKDEQQHQREPDASSAANNNNNNNTQEQQDVLSEKEPTSGHIVQPGVTTALVDKSNKTIPISQDKLGNTGAQAGSSSAAGPFLTAQGVSLSPFVEEDKENRDPSSGEPGSPHGSERGPEEGCDSDIMRMARTVRCGIAGTELGPMVLEKGGESDSYWRADCSEWPPVVFLSFLRLSFSLSHHCRRQWHTPITTPYNVLRPPCCILGQELCFSGPELLQSLLLCLDKSHLARYLWFVWQFRSLRSPHPNRLLMNSRETTRARNRPLSSAFACHDPYCLGAF